MSRQLENIQFKIVRVKHNDKFVHFLLIKSEYRNKTNNPNILLLGESFGLFSCGTSVHNRPNIMA